MENRINERINSLMDSQRLNANNFAKAIGKSYTAIYGILKGSSKPSFELLEAILETYPAVNPTWLLTGSGEMFLTDVKDASKPEPSGDYLKEHLHTLEENFARLASQLETKDHQLESKDDQIKSKDDQIKSLTRMLESVLGKPKGASFLSQVALMCYN